MCKEKYDGFFAVTDINNQWLGSMSNDTTFLCKCRYLITRCLDFVRLPL